MIYELIRKLVAYAEMNGLIHRADREYTINRLIELFQLDYYMEPQEQQMSIEELVSFGNLDLEQILSGLLDYAYEKGLLQENSITERDLYDTMIMGLVTPSPSVVIEQFNTRYAISANAATDYYYQFCQSTDYIRKYRIEKDIKWITKTEYGDLDITINLSKPEKDPKAIAAAKQVKQSSYPKCLLCKENVGYAGRANHPARQNHRIIPVTISNQPWSFQYSPYVYYNEHCIIFNNEHVPMKIDKSAFRKLLDFVIQFPHYFVGSNADLPIVGGSILSHDHFQGGNYEFAMAKAPVEKSYSIKGFENVELGIVAWPMSVIRLTSRFDYSLVELADHILKLWRGYSDESVQILAETEGEPHNTITPIARKRGEFYELDLVLRNNLTTQEHPDGLYHAHSELHHIKKENIGLIEVMGLAILPPRLKEEMELLKEYILKGNYIHTNEMIMKHAYWVEEFLPRYENITRDNIDGIIQDEIGKVFLKVLEHAGVFKRTEQGLAAFERFIKKL